MPKREDYIDWNTYFMKIAKISSQRSKDPQTQVGACVVGKNNMILGIGYNGFPRGCSDNDFPWERPKKYLYVCHAEMNALLNSNNLNLVEGSKIYSTLFPCNNCAKLIIQLGIQEVIYLDDKYKDTEEDAASRKMFDSVGIKYWKFELPFSVDLLNNKKISINGDNMELKFINGVQFRTGKDGHKYGKPNGRFIIQRRHRRHHHHKKMNGMNGVNEVDGVISLVKKI